jgi:hypothetical protein
VIEFVCAKSETSFHEAERQKSLRSRLVRSNEDLTTRLELLLDERVARTSDHHRRRPAGQRHIGKQSALCRERATPRHQALRDPSPRAAREACEEPTGITRVERGVRRCCVADAPRFSVAPRRSKSSERHRLDGGPAAKFASC